MRSIKVIEEEILRYQIKISHEDDYFRKVQYVRHIEMLNDEITKIIDYENRDGLEITMSTYGSEIKIFLFGKEDNYEKTFIDWGDGIIDYEYPNNETKYNSESLNKHTRWIPHSYSEQKSHTIKISAKNITILDCSHNNIFHLDVSESTELNLLDCSGNNLSNLDVNKNKKLKRLICKYNDFEKLDISGASSLTELDCSCNKLTSLKISGAVALTKLNCSYNKLTRLEISGAAMLTGLNCSSNKLSVLDISGTIALISLSCSGNQLESLDASNNSVLTYLYCSENKLTSLGISGATVLQELFCSNNQLTSLDLRNNTALEKLECDSDKLTCLIVDRRNKVPIVQKCKSERMKEFDWIGCRSWGCIDKNGKVIIPIIYSHFYDDNNVAWVQLGSKIGFIDKTGKEVVLLKYDEASLYGFYDEGDFLPVKLNGKWGFINKTGKEIIPIKYDSINGKKTEFVGRESPGSRYLHMEKSFTYGSIYGHFKSGGLALVELKGKWGFIDETGKEVIPIKYDSISLEKEKFVAGERIPSYKHDIDEYFSYGGFARVKLNKKWGFIDKTGKEVIPVKFEEARDFKDGLARVKLKGKWGMIDKLGRIIIPIKQDYVYDVHFGKVKVDTSYDTRKTIEVYYNKAKERYRKERNWGCLTFCLVIGFLLGVILYFFLF